MTCQLLADLQYLIMEEKSKGNDAHKLERLLSTHSLQGLVYEKRQRKQAANSFTQIYAQSMQKNKLKPKQKPKEKKEVKLIKRQSKIKQKQEKPKQIKTQIKSNNAKVNQQQGSPVKKRGRPRKQKIQRKPHIRKEKQIQSDKQQSLSLKIKQQEQQQQVQNCEDQSQQDASVQKQAKKQEQNSDSVEDQKSPDQIPATIQKKEKQQPKKSNVVYQPIGFKKFKKASTTSQKQEIDQNEQKLLEKRQQEKSEEMQKAQQELIVHKITRVHSVSQLIDSFNDQQKNQKSCTIESKEKDDNQIENMENENNQMGSNKRVLRARRNYVSNEQPKQIQQNEEDSQSDQQSKKRPRLRRRKEDQLRKFGGEGDDVSEYEANQNYGGRRRRGVADKDYQINRIFRKSQKTNLPNVKLEVDMMRFSLQNFAQKFKEFDMIHCSLPLDMLVQLQNISALINKGFIFIWAEKGQIQAGYHWLNRLGFDVIDQIVWTKTNKTINQVICDKKTENQIFPNSKSTCLVGYKCSSTQKTQYCTKISNNLIFEAEYHSTLQKPDQIYEIGDLMMPGAKKLEIGYKQIGGWFTLKHREESMVRCHQCFRRGTHQLYLTKNKSVICQYCIDFNQRKEIEQAQEEQQQKIQQKVETKKTQNALYSLKIIYQKFENVLMLRCENCSDKVLELLKITNQLNEAEKSLCKKCFVVPEQICQITVTKTQRAYFPNKSIKCSKCQKNRLYKYYYECFSCKQDHIMCSSCFMQPRPTEPIPPMEQQDQKSHDWKLKIINQFPETRALCFTCNEQCSIPYYACEICQNWYWCGKCDNTVIPKAHPNHSHYFGQHQLHLII